MIPRQFYANVKFPLVLLTAGIFAPFGCERNTPTVPAAPTQAKVISTKPRPKNGTRLEYLERQKSIRQSLAAKVSSQAEPLSLALSSLAKYRPVQSGAGIVICEPVNTNADKVTADFAAGCGRWLHFTVGSIGALGKTPLWGAIDDVRHDMGRDDLQLTGEDAGRFARLVGATHVATGELIGAAPNFTLKYQLVKSPLLQPVGAPMIASGSMEQIVGQLPRLADEMAVQLKVAAPKQGIAGVVASDLQLIGGGPWKPREEVPGEQIQRLFAMVPKLPVAAVLWLRSIAATDSYDARFDLPASDLKKILNLYPDSVMINAEVGWRGETQARPYHATLIRLLQKYPNNYMLQAAEARWQRNNGKRALELRAAEQAVRCAPENAMAWIELEVVNSNRAQDIRDGRYYRDLNDAEMNALKAPYAAMQAMTTRATQLNPVSAYAFTRLSQAAGFNGDEFVANKALWEAVKLDPDETLIYEWGMEMYQEKWYSNKEKLRLLGEYAEAYPERLSTVYNAVIQGFLADRQQVKSQQLVVSTVQLLQSEVKLFPDKYETHANLAYFTSLYGQDHVDMMIGEYEEMARIRPNDPRPYYQMALLHLEKKNDPKQAEVMFRKAISLLPGYYEAIAGLRKLERAKRELEQLAPSPRQKSKASVA